MLLLLLVLVAISITVIIVYRLNHIGINSHSDEMVPDGGPNYRALTECGTSKSLLTVLPIRMEDIESIAPLGGLNPPDHTIPTDHMYFMYRYERDSAERYPLLIPGNVVVTGISYSGDIVAGRYQNTDYSISFSPCRGLQFRMSHIDKLEGQLAAEIGPKGEGADCHSSSPAGERDLILCHKRVDLKLSAGQLIGEGGDTHVGAWDFWAMAAGYRDPGIRHTQFYATARAVCPLDYFTSEIQTQLYKKVSRTIAPRCGVIDQDLKGTLQGAWFAHQDPEQAFTDWNSHFSLVHDSTDPSMGRLAVGGKISESQLYSFKPISSGRINREPSQTVAGILYCYQQSDFGNQYIGKPGHGRILLELIDEDKMQAEYQDGACGGDESFRAPITYYR